MLFLLPQEVDRRQVFEIQVPSEARKGQIIKLGEVCWTRSIPVSTRLNMYLVGVRFLFELPLLIGRRWLTKRRSCPLRSAQGEGKGVSNHYLN